MILNLKYIIFCLLFFHLFDYSIGQNYKEDLFSVSKNVNNFKKVSFDVTANIYKTYFSKTPFITEHYYYKKSRNRILVTTDNFISLNYDTCNIVVSIERKIIDIWHTEQPNNNQQNLTTKDLDFLIDSTLEQTDSIIFKGINNNISHYIIYKSKSLFTKTDIFFDKKNRFLKKIIFYYNKHAFPQNNKVVVIYNNFTLSPSFSNKIFSPVNFVRRKHHILYASDKYKGFHVSYHQTNKE